MTSPDEQADFSNWMQTWQDDDAPPVPAAKIREYVTRRGRLVRAFMISDLVIGVVAVPLLAYLAWSADNTIDRLSMIALASITTAAVCFGTWNWRAVRRDTAATTAGFVTLSTERLRRMRTAWQFAWALLAAQIVIFTIWIGNALYAGPGPVNAAAERFAWAWLMGMALATALALAWFGRWLNRDAERFAALRRELGD